MKHDAHHLSIGVMTALAQTSSKNEDSSEFWRHLRICENCRHKFTQVRSLVIAAGESIPDASLMCDTTSLCTPDEVTGQQQALLLLAFTSESMPPEQAQRLLGHVNNCYACFESFCRNWSDYLKTQGSQNEKKRISTEK